MGKRDEVRRENKDINRPVLFNRINFMAVYLIGKYSLQGTTQGNGLTGGVPPVRFSM